MAALNIAARRYCALNASILYNGSRSLPVRDKQHVVMEETKFDVQHCCQPLRDRQQR